MNLAMLQILAQKVADQLVEKKPVQDEEVYREAMRLLADGEACCGSCHYAGACDVLTAAQEPMRTHGRLVLVEVSG